MKVFVAGGTGKTGNLVIQELLSRNYHVKTIKRNSSSISSKIESNSNLTIITGTILEMSDSKIEDFVGDCDAVISCLGHNLTCKGIFGQPKKIVTNTLEKICKVLNKRLKNKTIKLVLMNSSWVRNFDLYEEIPFSQQCIVSLLRIILPPHLDNEKAAEYLRIKIDQNNKTIQWVCIRPDTLIDKEKNTQYSLFISPQRNTIFNSGETSRINVAHFMAELISNENTWNKWKGQMPVIYNEASPVMF